MIDKKALLQKLHTILWRSAVNERKWRKQGQNIRASNFRSISMFIERLIEYVEEIPDVDAAEVVRCKNCKHYQHWEGYGHHCVCEDTPWYDENIIRFMPEDFFCSCGKRKE